MHISGGNGRSSEQSWRPREFDVAKVRTICGWQLTNLWRQSFENFFLSREFLRLRYIYAIIIVAAAYFPTRPHQRRLLKSSARSGTRSSHARTLGVPTPVR